MTTSRYLPVGLPIPTVDPNGLAAPFWEGLRVEKLKIQKCRDCGAWRWGPEWICHKCHSFDVAWVEVEPRGRIYSWERVWQATSPALKTAIPYLVVLVELEVANHVRLIGNLLGPRDQDVRIGAEVVGSFEHHADSDPAFTLLQWKAMQRNS